ncbi:MAG: hypothetical protein ACFB9N_18205 [Geitlerinemataceae cyanobacterium]
MPESDDTQVQGPKDLFSIRSRLVQYANPLRTKIVLFSALEHPFVPSNSADWAAIKRRDLGEFIRRAYVRYATLDELDRTLNDVAQRLEEPDECKRVVRAVVKELASQYDTTEVTETTAAEFDDADVSQAWDIPVGVSLIDSETGGLAPSDGDPSAIDLNASLQSEASITTALNTTVPPGASSTSSNDNSRDLSGTGEFLSDDDDDSDLDDDRSRWLDEFPVEAAVPTSSAPATAPPQSRTPRALPRTVPPPTHPDIRSARPTGADRGAAERRPKRRLSLVREIGQQVSAREEIDAIVQRYSQTLIEHVTAALDDLEEELADCLVDREVEDATPIAGEALGRVLNAVGRAIGQMQQTLEGIPGVEPLAQTLPAIGDAASTPTAEESQPEPETKPAIADTADTADPVSTIRARFETLLAQRDMSVRVKSKGGCLHLIVEASPLPERAKLIRFVTKNLRELDLPEIAAMRLHGRQKDARAFDWSEDLPPIVN